MTTTPPVWFITGSSRGLGKAIATYALGQGHSVVATARDVSSVSDLVDAYGPTRVLALQLDVTSAVAAEAAAQAAIKHFGQVNLLINNAGSADLRAFEDTSVEQFREQFEVNFYGVYNMSKAFVPILREQGHGHIFQISSVGDRAPAAGLAAYQAAKWAVTGMSNVLAMELGATGVKVTTLEPGALRTDWSGGFGNPRPSEAYREVIEAGVQRIQGAMHSTTTSLEKIGAVIWRLYGEKEPPLRILIGQDAVMYGPMLADALMKSDQAWAEAGKSVAE